MERILCRDNLAAKADNEEARKELEELVDPKVFQAPDAAEVDPEPVCKTNLRATSLINIYLILSAFSKQIFFTHSRCIQTSWRCRLGCKAATTFEEEVKQIGVNPESHTLI